MTENQLPSTAMNGEYFDAVLDSMQEVNPGLQDVTYFSHLPEELILNCASFLNVTSLLTFRTVNKTFSEIGSRNEAGWTERCNELWKDKVFVWKSARNHSDKRMGYKLSLHDSRVRQHLSLDELCYNELDNCGTIWSFRFKVSAGPDWTSWDPWWMGGQARQMVFLRNGSVKQYVREPASGETLESPTFGRLIDPPVNMEWRFISKPMDLPSRPDGSYLRFSVGGRDVPTYVVKRSPTNNWGFIAESCWGVYTSFDMPRRVKQDPRMRLRRSPSGRAHWLREADEDDEQEILLSTLNDDSIFTITNEVQWREALLYNFGASVLPDGDGATEDFDRMFGQTMHERDGVDHGGYHDERRA